MTMATLIRSGHQIETTLKVHLRMLFESKCLPERCGVPADPEGATKHRFFFLFKISNGFVCIISLSTMCLAVIVTYMKIGSYLMADKCIKPVNSKVYTYIL